MKRLSPFRHQTQLIRLAAVQLLYQPLAIGRAEDETVSGARFDADSNIAYPESHAVVDVTQAPYHAKGDGKTDDTEALQRALFDVMGQHKVLYLPHGTYLISRTLNWSKKNSADKDAWDKNFIQGQNVAKTIIRLKDSTFTDQTQPASIMWCGGFGSADWFHNYIQDVTFDVGRNNPGALSARADGLTTTVRCSPTSALSMAHRRSCHWNISRTCTVALKSTLAARSCFAAFPTATCFFTQGRRRRHAAGNTRRRTQRNPRRPQLHNDRRKVGSHVCDRQFVSFHVLQ